MDSGLVYSEYTQLLSMSLGSRLQLLNRATQSAGSVGTYSVKNSGERTNASNQAAISISVAINDSILFGEVITNKRDVYTNFYANAAK